MDGSRIDDYETQSLRVSARGRTRGQSMRNWKGSVTYRPAHVEVVQCVEDIVRVVRDRSRYPSPVRAKGSHHSTTEVVVAEGGTVLDMTRMDRIVAIDRTAMTITMQAGVLLIDAAEALRQQGLQFYVNIELGNLTVGSGACCGTKEASYYSSASGVFEFGQVASYVVGYKLVRADGSLCEVREGVDPDELLQALRSSYGMLGVIYEVTYKVKQLRPMSMRHERFDVHEFARCLDEVARPDSSAMLYLFPFLDTVVVERRADNCGAMRTPWQWSLRNLVWEHISPALAKTLSFIPVKTVRYGLVDAWCRLTIGLTTHCIAGSHTNPVDQLIRYSEQGGYAAYTFSIWAFEKEKYAKVLLAYFDFCKTYYAQNGYRCDMLNVGYAVAQDRSSLFSYTRSGYSLTLDPVSTGGEGWDGFITAFNQFCSEHGGKPLFNQTPGLKRCQVQKAFAEEIPRFQALRKQYDVHDRFYTPYFKQLLE